METETKPADWDDPARVTGDWVTVTRSLVRDEEAVIATLEVTTKSDAPATVEVADTFPEEWAASEVGVHPDQVPEEFVVDANRVIFTDTVGPESPLEVVYGVKHDGAEMDPLPDPPEIRSERALETLDGADDAMAVDGGLARPASQAESDGDGQDPAVPEDPDGPAVWEADPDGDAGDGADTRAADSDQADPAGDDPGELLGPDGTDDEPDEPLGLGVDDGKPDEDAGLVAAMAAELESGSAPEEALETLREAIAPASSKRQEARVDHLQSRVEEFAAYADALGDLLDDHGAPTDVLDEHADRLADLEGGLAGVRSDLDEAATDRDDLRDQLTATQEQAAAIDDVAEDLDAVREDLDAVRHEHGDDLDDLRSTVAALETRLDSTVDDLESDIAALEELVQTWDETRRQLSHAFGGEGEPTEDADPEE